MLTVGDFLQLKVTTEPMRLTELAQQQVAALLKPGDHALDASVGNGHDTLFLARCVESGGRVYGFDIQAQAIAATETLLQRHGIDWVTLYHGDHSNLQQQLPKECRLRAVMFNLGYLPGSNKEVVTRADSTLRALQACLPYLANPAIMTITAYRGHPGGEQEYQAVHDWVAQLPSAHQVQTYTQQHSRRPAPVLFSVKYRGL